MLLTDIATGRSERSWNSSFLHTAKHVKSAFRLCPESKTHIINKSKLLGVQRLTNDRSRHSQVQMHGGHTKGSTPELARLSALLAVCNIKGFANES
jgi:hypothetical protein